MKSFISKKSIVYHQISLTHIHTCIELFFKIFVTLFLIGFSVKEGGVLVNFRFSCGKKEEFDVLNKIHKEIKTRMSGKMMWFSGNKPIIVHLVKVGTFLSFLSLTIHAYIYTVLIYVFFF